MDALHGLRPFMSGVVPGVRGASTFSSLYSAYGMSTEDFFPRCAMARDELRFRGGPGLRKAPASTGVESQRITTAQGAAALGLGDPGRLSPVRKRPGLAGIGPAAAFWQRAIMAGSLRGSHPPAPGPFPPSCSAIAQLVEQQTVNLLVPGSSPGRGASFTRLHSSVG